MGYNKRYKRLSELTIAELACNKILMKFWICRTYLNKVFVLICQDCYSRTLADDSSRRRE